MFWSSADKLFQASGSAKEKSFQNPFRSLSIPAVNWNLPVALEKFWPEAFTMLPITGVSVSKNRNRDYWLTVHASSTRPLLLLATAGSQNQPISHRLIINY